MTLNKEKSIHIKKEEIEKALRVPPTDGKHMLEPFHSMTKEKHLPLSILEDVNVINDAEVHRHEGDLWYCLEGEVTFLCGGELIDPWAKENKDGTKDENELKARSIRGGETIILRAGDWLWIPPGEAHQHSCAGTARLIIIKISKKY